MWKNTSVNYTVDSITPSWSSNTILLMCVLIRCFKWSPNALFTPVWEVFFLKLQCPAVSGNELANWIICKWPVLKDLHLQQEPVVLGMRQGWKVAKYRMMGQNIVGCHFLIWDMLTIKNLFLQIIWFSWAFIGKCHLVQTEGINYIRGNMSFLIDCK